MSSGLLVLAGALLAAPALAQAPAVALKPLSEVAIHPERDAFAQVVALNESRIAAEISGRIEAIPVEVGQRIGRGAVVARIDCRDHELSRERTRAAFDAARSRSMLAEQQLERARELGAKGFFSKEALAARETELRVLRAEAEQARAQLDSTERAVSKCVVRSPFAAIVRERTGQVGELAAPGTPLAALIDAGRLEVAAQVQAADAGSLRRAAQVRFVDERAAHAVRLLRISPAIDRQARTLEARLRFAAAAAAPGASGRIAWRDAQPHLPAQLLVRRGGRLGIFVEENGIARFKPIAGAQEGRPAPVDLPPATRIVVGGQLAVQDGQKLP